MFQGALPHKAQCWTKRRRETMVTMVSHDSLYPPTLSTPSPGSSLLSNPHFPRHIPPLRSSTPPNPLLGPCLVAHLFSLHRFPLRGPHWTFPPLGTHPLLRRTLLDGRIQRWCLLICVGGRGRFECQGIRVRVSRHRRWMSEVSGNDVCRIGMFGECLPMSRRSGTRRPSSSY